MLNPKQSEDGNAPQNEPQNVMKQDAARSGAAHARVPELPRTGSAMSTSTAVPTRGKQSPVRFQFNLLSTNKTNCYTKQQQKPDC